MVIKRLACTLLLVSLLASRSAAAQTDSAGALDSKTEDSQSHNSAPADSATTGSTAANSQKTDSEKNETRIEGRVSVDVSSPFQRCMTDLLETAHTRDEDIQRFQAAVDHYGTKAGKLRDRTTDVLNYTFMYRGISISSEAGDVILDEKHKLKSLASARYLKQRKADELDLQVLTNVFEMAQALGKGDDSTKQIQQAHENLVKLVGQEKADSALATLKDLQATAPDDKTKAAPKWSQSQRQERIQQTVQSAAAKDAITTELQNDLHAYNKHRPGALAAQRMVRVTLSTASMSPSFAGPVAQSLMFGFLWITGGTEEHKLLTELYLDKRLSSRAHLLNEEAHLAFDNYELASLTNNRALKLCSEQLLKSMSGTDAAVAMLQQEPKTEAEQSTMQTSPVVNQ